MPRYSSSCLGVAADADSGSGGGGEVGGLKSKVIKEEGNEMIHMQI